MALPKGLLIRGSSFFFQARIPKQHQKHYPTAVIRDKLHVANITEAVVQVHECWAKLHQEFATYDKQSRQAHTLSDDEIARITKQLIHELLAGDDDHRLAGTLDSESYTIGLDEANYLFKTSYTLKEGAKPKDIQHLIDQLLWQHDLNVPRGSESYNKLTLAALESGLDALALR